MKASLILKFTAVLILSCAQRPWAQTVTPQSTPSGPISLQIEEDKLEIEKLKLENEKLQLETEKIKLLNAQTPVPAKTLSKEDSKEDLKVYQGEVSKKAGELAKANEDKENTLVLDLVNGEVWNKGVRYNLHELYTLFQDRGWKPTRKMNGRDPSGHPRYLDQYRNISLLRYENRDRGIITVSAPSSPEDFDILTPEGISFASTNGDARNAFQNMYYTYDRQVEEGGLHVLRYSHSRGLAFDDKLEVFYDKTDKIVKLKYGVLDER